MNMHNHATMLWKYIYFERFFEPTSMFKKAHSVICTLRFIDSLIRKTIQYAELVVNNCIWTR